MPEFYKLSVDEALSELNTQTDGLSEQEVKERLKEYGRNELPRDEGVSWLELIWNQFNDPLIWLLIAAALISAFLGEITDMVVITIIIVLNAALGIYQEYQAEQALAALASMQTPSVRIRRQGKVKTVEQPELVPGDIVLLEEGDSIPADGRLLESTSLRTQEAALTGESNPVSKDTAAINKDNVSVGDRENMVFMGTAVNAGRGEMVVTHTGLDTELGEIANMLQQVERGETPLQRRLAELGKVLTIGAMIVVAVVFFVGVFLQGISIREMFLIAVSLAVAAVPEGLPALVTIGLSLGASRMVERNALIRRLPAVETLGSVTIICSDKTGTLTKNQMTATHLALPGHDDVLVSGVGYQPEGEFEETDGDPVNPKEDEAVARFLKAMALSTNAHLEEISDEGTLNVVGDTTEGAMIVAARKVGWTRDKLEQDLPRIGELPFNSERKAMSTLHEVKGDEAQHLFGTDKYISITKGAPDKLIQQASQEHTPEGRKDLSEERIQAWKNHNETLAREGLRVLTVAYRQWDSAPDEMTEAIEQELVLLGMVGIQDPARPEAREAVTTARQAGIRTIMITGDHALTGEAIARDLGILKEDERAITGDQLNTMSDDEIRAALKETACFARVSPSHKLKLVKMLQDEGHIAAMTGDGVNDAPALKQADIGVAMGITGTDVSKGAAAMVLTDDNFASIVSAVEQGRAIYDNIRKFIKYLLSSNVGEILTMFVALLVGLKVPLLAIQILWINLVTDGLPAIALGFEPAEEDVMERKPRPRDESIFASGVGRHIVIIGILIAAITLGGYMWGYSHNGLDPFSDTHGLETLSAEQLQRFIDNTNQFSGERMTVPDGWDTLSEEARVDALFAEGESVDGESEAGLHAQGGGLVGLAERLPRTIAFTILAFTQMFEVMAIHSGDRVSFFRKGFSGNWLLLGAVVSTFLLQLAVIYIPFLQASFETSALTLTELAVCFAMASLILFAVEIEKLLNRRTLDTHEYVEDPNAIQHPAEA